MIKAGHELWVQSTLSGTGDDRVAAHNLIYTSLIDTAVENLQLENWNVWTSWVLMDTPKLAFDAPDRIRAFTHRVIAAPWPGTLDELERSLKTLAHIMNEALSVFMAHAEKTAEEWIGAKFYKYIREWNPELYNSKFLEWQEWLNDLHQLFREATKAANWFADVVRRDVNPNFFAIEGRSLLTEGPFMDFSFQTYLIEYTTEEKQELPDVFFEKRREKNRTRAPNTGPQADA
jgi:hypothetical protein